MVCGSDTANSKYACIWCTCPKEDRYDTSKEWSITDEKKGSTDYSRTSDNGPSEKRTTSLQRTHSLLRNETTIVIVLKQPLRNGRFLIPDSGQELYVHTPNQYKIASK